ncbi:MAG: lytic murein transglycosylase, partial [Proteobacteria bacterium]
WGMETDFRMGRSAKQSPVITSMATLAYDCRRAAAFRMNLLASLHLLEKREVAIENMVGEWAGEMSGLQFTPSNFWEFGVDFDGDGKRDPVNSVADMMGTAANMFIQNGWRRGEPYMVEVKVPANMAWEEADMTVTKVRPMSFWQQQGVTSVTGGALPNANMQGALMLPMGRLGPAFIAYPNFRALLKWNASSNNALTAAYLASRIVSSSTPAMSPGRGKVEVMTSPEIKQIQTLLAAKGYNIGKIDGFIGTGTREAVRTEQLKLGLPADAYPTHELLTKLR